MRKRISREFRVKCHYTKGHYADRNSFWFIYNDGTEKEVTQEEFETQENCG